MFLRQESLQPSFGAHKYSGKSKLSKRHFALAISVPEPSEDANQKNKSDAELLLLKHNEKRAKYAFSRKVDISIPMNQTNIHEDFDSGKKFHLGLPSMQCIQKSKINISLKSVTRGKESQGDNLPTYISVNELGIITDNTRNNTEEDNFDHDWPVKKYRSKEDLLRELKTLHKDSIIKSNDFKKIQVPEQKNALNKLRKYPHLASSAVNNKLSQRSQLILTHAFGPLVIKENQEQVNIQSNLPTDWHIQGSEYNGSIGTPRKSKGKQNLVEIDENSSKDESIVQRILYPEDIRKTSQDDQEIITTGRQDTETIRNPDNNLPSNLELNSNNASVVNQSQKDLIENIKKNFKRRSSKLFSDDKEEQITNTLVNSKPDLIEKSESIKDAHYIKQVNFDTNKHSIFSENIEGNISYIANNFSDNMTSGDNKINETNDGLDLENLSKKLNSITKNKQGSLSSSNQLSNSVTPMKPKICIRKTELSTKDDESKDQGMFGIRRFGGSLNKCLEKDETLTNFSKIHYEERMKKAHKMIVKPVTKENVSYDKYYENLKNSYLLHENENCKSVIKDLKVHLNVDLNMMLHEYKIAKELRTEAWKTKIAQSSRENSQRSMSHHKILYSRDKTELSDTPMQSARQQTDKSAQFVTEENTSRIIGNHCIDKNLLYNTNYKKKLHEFVGMNSDRINNTDLSITKRTKFRMNCFSFNSKQNLSNERAYNSRLESIISNATNSTRKQIL